MKEKSLIIMLFCFLIGNGFLFCQQIYDGVGFSQLPLEEQLETYFNTYRTGHTSTGYQRIASYIAKSYGIEVIPYLKEYMNNADLFSLRKNWPPRRDFWLREPNDITLELVAEILRQIHLDGTFDAEPPYTIDENEIQWFFDKYKRCIDEYVLAVRAIDETVLASERMLDYVACGGRRLEACIEEYGHPYFGIIELYRRGRVLKEYYEQRLGISELTIDYNVFQE